jgi:DNA-binding beta-propeller fold protein YncE
MKTTSLILFLFFIAPQAESQSDTGLVWPQPPDNPRIKYIESFSSSEAFKQKSGGFFSRIASFLFGENDKHNWLVQPVGVAVAADGRVYVTDPGAHGVHVFDFTKKEYEFLSQNNLGRYHSPVGVVVARDGNIYISDSERGDIMVLNDDNDPKFIIKDSLVRPTGICIFREKLYVADPGKQAILMFDLAGKFLGEFGRRGLGDGEFNFPISLVADKSLYVVDALNYRIQEFDLSGNFVSKFGKQGNTGGSLASPKSVALDSDGNIYVTDALMDNFQIFDKEGQLLLVVGQRGEGNGRFMSPNGITIDSHDKIYIVDMLNKRIQIFKYLK